VEAGRRDLDVMLPKMTGLEVLQRRRADDDGAAVIYPVGAW